MTKRATVYVPRDSVALALGADAVAARVAREAEARGWPVHVVRTGSRGLHWLEPMVEVLVGDIRHAYGPVGADDVPTLFDAGFLEGSAHPLAQGPTEDIDFLKNQQRLIFARCGIVDPLSLDDYGAHGGLAGLRRALAMAPPDIIADIAASGLRGRGGAAFPAHIKWQTVHDAAAAKKYIVCNADEGDSGTFADRMIME
ncbi:MAG: formate dehydrogenase beta subunit, partial [Alphaproteobacteria bacterium]